MKIYTKTGDDGTTGLFGGGRVPKDSARIAAYGDVDELNSFIGFCAAAAQEQEMESFLKRIQEDLFVLGADLATPLETRSTYNVPRITEENAKRLERAIDEHTALLPDLKKFILPGGSELASRFHLGRTVCRRAERSLVHLAASEEIGTFDVIYLNRLSDLLFTLARRANQLTGVGDVEWEHRKR
ncbi:MAG TPA: cob(I)yrinic acid a,c-diamide adenosyltransferase [Candidatus Kapabacteria bacterium]